MYISEKGVDNLLREVHSVAAKGSRLLLMVCSLSQLLGAACSRHEVSGEAVCFVRRVVDLPL